VTLLSQATALAISVFPFPGGPYRRIPLGGALIPWNMSGRALGKITDSWRAYFTASNPTVLNENRYEVQKNK